MAHDDKFRIWNGLVNYHLGMMTSFEITSIEDLPPAEQWRKAFAKGTYPRCAADDALIAATDRRRRGKGEVEGRSVSPGKKLTATGLAVASCANLASWI